MVKVTLKIDGMMCGMCEAHINDAIRSHFTVQRVSSSHRKGETVIYAADPPDLNQLASVLSETRYTLRSVSCEPAAERPVFFGLFRKNK